MLILILQGSVTKKDNESRFFRFLRRKKISEDLVLLYTDSGGKILKGY